MKIVTLLFAVCLGSLLVGCVNTVDGRKQMGVPFLKDKIESRYERTVDQVFAASKTVLGYRGTLNSENTIGKTLEAKVDQRNVFVRVYAEDPKVTRITVQARTSGGGADIDLASEIDKLIALQLQIQPKP